jgi:hypothetical protein
MTCESFQDSKNDRRGVLNSMFGEFENLYYLIRLLTTLITMVQLRGKS